MRAGRRNRKITIQRLTSGRGDYGEVTEDTWATHKQPFANVKQISGGETIQGGQVDAKATHMFTIRKTDVTPADRISYDSRIFNISRVINPEERGIDQQIIAIEDV